MRKAARLPKIEPSGVPLPAAIAPPGEISRNSLIPDRVAGFGFTRYNIGDNAVVALGSADFQLACFQPAAVNIQALVQDGVRIVDLAAAGTSRQIANSN